MRKAWIIGCVLGLTALGCEDAADTPRPIESERAVDERESARDAPQDEREAELRPKAEEATPFASTGEERPMQLGDDDSTGATSTQPVAPPLDPRVPRAMEFGELEAPREGPLWGARTSEPQQGAFIVREGGQSYWVGRPEEEAAAQAGAEPTEIEARLAEADARVAEAEARALEAEARLAEATGDAERAATLREQQTRRGFVAGPGVVIGVPSGTFEEFDTTGEATATTTDGTTATSSDETTTTTTDGTVATTTTDGTVAPSSGQTSGESAAGLGQQGVSADPGLGQQGVGLQPGLGQEGLGLQPGLGQQGVGVQPGVGQGGVPPSTGAGGGL